MTEREWGAERPLFVALSTAPTPPRDLTPAECVLLAEGQARMAARKVALEAEAAQVVEVERAKRENRRDFQAALRSCDQPQLLPPAAAAPERSQKSKRTLSRSQTQRGRFETPSRPTGAATIPDSLEAALASARPPQLGSPAALAAEATERARPIIEAASHRKDGRRLLLTVLKALYEAAYTLLSARGQSTRVTSCTFFTVMDLLPAVTFLSPDQCERATSRLQRLGLIHKSSGAVPTGQVRRVKDRHGQERQRKRYRGGSWTTTSFLNAETGERVEAQVCAGTWIDVLLRPAPGLSARVRAHELPQECPRDLTTDRKTGHTAWQVLKDFYERGTSKVRESLALSGTKFDIALLLTWALPKDSFSNPVTAVDTRTSTPSLASLAAAATPEEMVYSLSTIVSEHPQHRREAIQAAGHALARIFQDTQSIRHYYRILWRATAAEHRGLRAYAQLQAAMTRTLGLMRDARLRAPGAYLLKQLAKAGWVEAVYYAA